MTKPYDFSCPVARSLEVIGDRWTLLIVRELLLGRHRYSTLAQALPGIPPNLLADRLHLLENEEIVKRLGPRQGYQITEKGQELAPVLGRLALWGMQHYNEPPNALATHQACGGTVRITASCTVCGQEVDAPDLSLSPRPPTIRPTTSSAPSTLVQKNTTGTDAPLHQPTHQPTKKEKTR